MLAVLIRIDGYDPGTGAPVSLFASSVDDPSVCHLDGATWWPALSKLPTLRYDLFDGAFAGQIVAPSSSVSMSIEPWPDFARYILADARLRLWTGTVGDAWAAYTLRFDGRITSQPATKDGTAALDFAVDDRWLDKALLATFAGTTGAEGVAALKGQTKPLALGAPRYVPGTLIDTVNSVFQVSGYGVIDGFDAALERLARFGAPIADYASYASLVAASIPPGAWATAKAVGMARFGAPPNGQISFLVRGDAAGPDSWARKPGQIIRRLATLSGGAGKIDNASLNALDASRPYTMSLYLDQQTTARDIIQRIAASVNAVAGVSWTGQLFVLPVMIGGSTVTLAADGTQMPPVASIAQLENAAPWQTLALTAERTWTVHPLADVAFTAPLIAVGDYAATSTYREGNIVQDQSATWLYVATAPSSGHAPPTIPDTANVWWTALPGGGTRTFATATAPVAPNAGDIWAPPGGPVRRFTNGVWVAIATRNDDAANMIPAPNDPETWGLANGAFYNPIGTQRPAAAHAVALPGTFAQVFWAQGMTVPCVPNETLWLQHAVAGDQFTPANGNVRGGFALYRADGSYVGAIDVPASAVSKADLAGDWVVRYGSAVTLPESAFAAPYSIRAGDAGGTFYVGEPYLSRAQPGADVTAQNQHSLSDVDAIVLQADYQGKILAGQLPVVRSVRHYLGQADVTPGSSVTVNGGGLSVTINNTVGSDSRGNVSLNAAGTGTITVASTYAGVTLYRSINVSIQLGSPPSGGGGGGGGSPGSPASTSGPFGNPGTSTSYVTLATLPAVVIGSGGTVELAAALSFFQQLDGPNEYAGTGLDIQWQAAVNGGGFSIISGSGYTSEYYASRYNSSEPPKGLRENSGSLNRVFTPGGFASGASVVFRITGVQSNSNYGVTAISGGVSATPK